MKEDLKCQVFAAVKNADRTAAINHVKLLFRDYHRTESAHSPVDVVDEDGMTPLQHAAYKGDAGMVQYLCVDLKADPNFTRQEHNYTALHFAALSQNHETCFILLKYGAKAEAVNSVGRTAAQMAGFVGNHDCVSIINQFVEPWRFVGVWLNCVNTMKLALDSKWQEPLYKFIHEVNIWPVGLAKNLPLALVERQNAYEPVKTFLKQLSMMDQKGVVRHKDSGKEMAKLLSITEGEAKEQLKDVDLDVKPNDSLSFKLYYLGHIYGEITSIKGTNPEETVDNPSRKIDIFVRKFLKKDSYVESLMKKCILGFAPPPGTSRTVLYKQMTNALKNREDCPPAFTIVTNAIHGQRFVSSDLECSVCRVRAPLKSCAACKGAKYCDQQCQKWDWFRHKDKCAKIATGELKPSDMEDMVLTEK